MAVIYDYLSLTLPRGREAWNAFATQAAGPGAAGIAAAGGELTSLFSPQLGFASNEAVALIRWPTGDAGSVDALTGAHAIGAWSRELLTPTLRPLTGQALRDGGIYVHRWFTVDGDRVSEFIELSGKAWGGFEGAYDTEIFGLFTASPTAADRAAGQGRLLLLTWYASHGVWEASREQTTDSGGYFVKRHALTRATIGRSSLRLPVA